MTRLSSTWLLCLGLVLTRLLGVHVHACSGLDGHQHEAPHYADSGLLFGESHHGDHGDNLELDLVAAAGPGALADRFAPDPAVPAPHRAHVTTSTGWLTVRLTRGPPAPRTTRPAGFTPPLRGPPENSLA